MCELAEHLKIFGLIKILNEVVATYLYVCFVLNWKLCYSGLYKNYFLSSGFLFFTQVMIGSQPIAIDKRFFCLFFNNL